MLTSKQIRELIAKGEAVRLECKKATGGLPSSLWSSYCAFANSDGGVILLGVGEGSAGLEIVGVEDSARLIRDFWNSVNNPDCVSWSMLFDRYVYAVDCGGKSVVVIEVPRAPREARPVCTGKNPFEGTFRRTGEGDYRCTRESVEAMIRDRANETADSCLLDELTMDVLDADTLSRYRHRFDNLRPGHVWTGLPVDEFLVDIGERSGIGLSNIVGTWKKSGFVAPRLIESVDPESVSLLLEVGSSVESGASSVESSVESGASSVEILNLLNANPQITLSEVAIRLKLTTRAVEKSVGKLKAEGKVKRIGPKKGGHWVVSFSGAKAFPFPIRHKGKPLTDEEIDAAKKLGRK